MSINDKEIINLRTLNDQNLLKSKEYKELIEDSTEKIKSLEMSLDKLKLENRNFKEINSKLMEDNSKLLHFKSNIVKSLDIETNFNFQETVKLNYSYSNLNFKNNNEEHEKMLGYESSNNNVKDGLKSETSRVNKDNENNSIVHNNNENILLKNNISMNNSMFSESKRNEPCVSIYDKIQNIRIKLNNNSNNKQSNVKLAAYLTNNLNKSNNSNLNTINYNNKRDHNYNYKNRSLIFEMNESDFNNKNIEDSNFKKKFVNKSNQFILSSKFFNNCKINLTKDEYNELIETIQRCNENIISKDQTIKIVEALLISKNSENCKKLIQDFKSIFNN